MNSRRFTRSPRRRARADVGDFEAERLGGFEIEDELEFGGLKHRQVGRLLAAENTPRIDADLVIGFAQAGAVAR